MVLSLLPPLTRECAVGPDKKEKKLDQFKAVKGHMNKFGFNSRYFFYYFAPFCVPWISVFETTLNLGSMSLSHISIIDTLAVCVSLHLPPDSSHSYFSWKDILIYAKASHYKILSRAQKSLTQGVTSMSCNKRFIPCSSKPTSHHRSSARNLKTSCARWESYRVEP